MPSTASSSTTSSAERARPFAAIVAALVLAAWFAHSAIDAFPRQLGIDFYQFWGVPEAKRVSGNPRSPYVDAAAYGATLNALADASSSAKLHAANARC